MSGTPGASTGRSKPPAAPAGSSATAAKLWRETLTVYDLDAHEVALLRHACAVETTCSSLQAVIAAEGPVGEDGKVTPALVELRLQQALFSRLIASLRIPVESTADEPRTQRHAGARGPYGPRAVS